MDEDELFADLEKQMEYMPCESPVHETSEQHAGPGIWYMTSSCPVCHDGPIRTLICDRYKQLLPAMVSIIGNTVVKCTYCEEYFLSREIIYEFERRQP